MNTNNHFVEKNLNLILPWIILFCVTFSACDYRTYNTIYVATDKEKIYDSRLPCEVLVVVKIEEEKLKKLELIGTCSSNMRAGGLTGKVNNAMKEIKKCACINGGDLMLIVNTKETSGVAGGGIIEQNNPNATKVIYSDKIEALVYRKKQ